MGWSRLSVARPWAGTVADCTSVPVDEPAWDVTVALTCAATAPGLASGTNTWSERPVLSGAKERVVPGVEIPGMLVASIMAPCASRRRMRRCAVRRAGEVMTTATLRLGPTSRLTDSRNVAWGGITRVTTSGSAVSIK